MKQLERVAIIQSELDKRGGTDYLEIGVQRGETFFHIACKNKRTVDPQPIVSWKRKLYYWQDYFFQRWHRLTSDDFFGQCQSVFDVVFVDGLHTHEQSFADFMNAAKHLKPGGAVVLHDCNRTKNDNPMYRDMWRTPALIRSLAGFSIKVYDCDHGVGVVTLEDQPQGAYTPEQVRAMDFETFDADRAAILNLVPYEG